MHALEKETDTNKRIKLLEKHQITFQMTDGGTQWRGPTDLLDHTLLDLITSYEKAILEIQAKQKP